MFKCFSLVSSSILLEKYENMLLSLVMMILINPLNTILKHVSVVIPHCSSSQCYTKTPKPLLLSGMHWDVNRKKKNFLNILKLRKTEFITIYISDALPTTDRNALVQKLRQNLS